MIILNFAHPITPAQQAAIEEMTGQAVTRVVSIATQFDNQQPFGPQAAALIEAVGLTSEQWQTEAILLNLPSLSVIAALALAGIQGRCGYFPGVIRLRPVEGAVPPRFEVAEILDVQGVRSIAREQRQ